MRPFRPEQVDADPLHTAPAAAGAEVGRIVAEVTARREAGEVVSDAEILARYPDLLPGLADELRAATRARAALLQGRRAGPIDRPLRALTFEELDAPLELDAEGAEGVGAIAQGGEPQRAGHRALPVIEGYRVLNELGDGGQATVYRAVQEITGRAVAVKVMLGGPFGTSRSRARLDAEAAALASIDHPHVVRIVDRGRARDGSPFIAMDLIDGLPLDEYVERIRPALSDVIRLWAKVARGVEEAHRHGIVHRDLKPANVLVDARGDPHVMDFGLAHRDVDTGADGGGPLGARALSRTHTGQIVGSLPWSSPEQVGALPGCAVDARSDVYSLAVLAYQSLTGEWPYDVSGPVHAVLCNIAEGRPVALGRTRRRWRVATEPAVGAPLAAELEAVIAKALAKAPADRYQAADEFAAALESLVERATSGTLMARRYFRRQAVRVGAVVAVCVVACALAAAGWTAAAKAWQSHAHPHPHVIYEAGPANEFGMRFVRLPGGTFFMGSPRREPGHADDEVRHAMRINRSFEIATTEVTRGQYAALMGALPPGAANAGMPDQPVSGVTWDEANAFCDRLSERVGRSCRLPTEAEWEYACRGGSDTAFANGGNELDDLGWSAERAGGVRHAVATVPPNAFGLYDMHGGVAEWCEDRYDAAYPPASDRAVVDARQSPPTGVRHVTVRGGSDHDPASRCRSAARAFAAPESRSDRIGFRVVMDVQVDTAWR